MVVVIMIALNAGFNDGFVITVPAFIICFRSVVGSGESIAYPNQLRNRLKAFLFMDGGMGMSCRVLLQLSITPK